MFFIPITPYMRKGRNGGGKTGKKERGTLTARAKSLVEGSNFKNVMTE